MKKGTFVVGAVVGGLVAGASAILFAPQSGEKTRSQLKDAGKKAAVDAKNKGLVLFEDAKKASKELCCKKEK